MFAFRLCLLGGLLAVLTGCDSAPACRGQADCPGGQVCADGSCRTPGTDRDGDGIPDGLDRCPDLDPGEHFPLADQRDSDGDGVGDLCDSCPTVADPAQRDADGDGLGDACSSAAVLEREPYNDYPTSAPRLPIGPWVEGEIGPPDPGPDGPVDRDWWLLSGRAGERFLLQARPWPASSLADPYLELRDAASGGIFYRRLDDDGDGNPAARLEVVLPEDGDYLLLVSDFANEIGGARVGGVRFGYRLRAQRTSPPLGTLPPADSRRTVALPSGRLAGLALVPPGPGLLTVRLLGGGRADPALSITGLESDRLLAHAETRPDCPGSPDAGITLCLTGEPVALWLESVGLLPEPEPLVLEIALSGPTAAQTLDGELPPDGGERLWRLPAASLERLRIQVTSLGPFEPALEVFECSVAGGAPRSLARSTAGTPETAGVELLPLAPADRHARVFDRREADGACPAATGTGRRFLLQAASSPAEPAPEPEADTSWAPPEPGSLGLFRLTARAEERLVIRATAAAGSAARPYLVLVDPVAGRVLARDTSQSAESTPWAGVEWVPPETTELWLLLSDMAGGGAAGFEQRLSLERRALPALRTTESPLPNDSPEQAQSLPDEALVLSGELSPPSDERDCFAFVLPPGEQVALATWPAEPGAVPDTTLSLFDDRGRLLAVSDDQGGSSLAAVGPLPGRGAGFLLVRLEARGNSRQPYRLEVRREPLPAGGAFRPLPGDLTVNEVLLEPDFDLTGDGRLDAGDQYLELVHCGFAPLELQGLIVWAEGGGALFSGSLRLDPGQALLLFNGLPVGQPFPAPAFGRGRADPWFTSGADAVWLGWQDLSGGSSIELERVFVPASPGSGQSVNRVIDGDAERVLRPHAGLVGAQGPRSPGTRVDGTTFN